MTALVKNSGIRGPFRKSTLKCGPKTALYTPKPAIRSFGARQNKYKFLLQH